MKNKPTREVRYNTYSDIKNRYIEALDNGLWPDGFCYHVKNVTGWRYRLEDFPELKKSKPRTEYAKTHTFWMPLNKEGIKARIKILNKCKRQTR